jgi:acylphosphatase
MSTQDIEHSYQIWMPGNASKPPACRSRNFTPLLQRPPSGGPALSATIYRFVSEPKQARRYFVSGTVQGVGFRYFTERAAGRLHVSGYTRNLPDGRVEVYAIGTPEQLANLRSALERGPWGASVREVQEEPAEIDPHYEYGFVISY